MNQPLILQSPTGSLSGRRSFLRTASLLPFASAMIGAPPSPAPDESVNVFGPRPGYSPMLGPLVSEMTWMRMVALMSVKGMKQEQLDFLLDDKANTIGALLLHLAAAEKLYQLNTFEGVSGEDLDKHPAFKDWQVPMNLGDPARKAIKGHSLEFYVDTLHETREKTLAELKKRDDQWLLAVDKSWPWGPTNNYCKWFHVCEHESNHNGQIKFLKSRLPGAKPENG